MSNLKTEYKEIVVSKLQNEFNYTNPHQIPKLEKIVISASLGLNAQNKTFLQNAINEIRTISGQQPILTIAKKSIAGFKIREGMPLGLVVTLRRDKMYAFLEKFIKLVLPRLRDFRGLNPNQFDSEGNIMVANQAVSTLLKTCNTVKYTHLILIIQILHQANVYFMELTNENVRRHLFP